MFFNLLEGSARILHASGISLAISASACDATFEAMSLARDAGVLVSFDTNLRLRLWPLARARAMIGAAMATLAYLILIPALLCRGSADTTRAS